MNRPLLAVLAISLALPAAVSAEEDVVETRAAPEFGIGARIGGYGFRDVSDGVLSWDDCRMNGTGLFGTVDLGRHFFGELSTDYYHATGSSAAMDRVSFFPAASAGFRMFAGKLVTPYVQVGGGPEFTRIDVDAQTTRKVLPSAYMGVGGELNIKSFHFGANIKAFTMGLPEHAHGVVAAHLEPAGEVSTHAHDAELRIRQEVAGMGQFFVRYSF